MQLQQLVLETTDPGSLKTFYKDLLGLSVTGNEERIVINAGASELVFKKAIAGEPFYHYAFTIPANAIEKAKAWLEKKVKLIWIGDYKGEIANFVNWHAKSIYFFDPAGNIVELIARFDLDNASDDPFSPQQILAVSEAGVVFNTSELEQRTTELLQRFHLSYFDKQPPLPQFKAIGDDEGMFIIVNADRNWYPTTKASGIFPMQIKFINKEEAYELKL